MPNRSQNQNKGSGRGFASMDAAKQRAIASAGGRAAHRSGNAHEFDVNEAREAGRRGGLARSASRISEHSVELAGGQGVMRMQDRDQEPGNSRTPGRDDGRSGRKGHGSMRTAEKHHTEADDANTRSGRGKHH
jgi:general stress protein YciG